MKHWDEIFGIAAGNYGIITMRQAKAVCANADVELPRWAKTGRLLNIGRGVYKLVQHTPTPYDQYAAAAALVGEGAFLYGESVLAINDLAFVNPPVVYVATKRRNRRSLPDWIKVVFVEDHAEVSECFGIPCQRVADAFRACKGIVPKSRLRKAIGDALRAGIIMRRDADMLRKEWR